MPIKFTVCSDDGYYIANYVGRITNDSVIADFRAFFESGNWSTGLNELADLSESDLTEVTSLGVQNLASFIEEFAKKHDWRPKVAVYAPRDLPYGLARVYSVKACKFENLQVFRDRSEAKSWLCSV